MNEKFSKPKQTVIEGEEVNLLEEKGRFPLDCVPEEAQDVWDVIDYVNGKHYIVVNKGIGRNNDLLEHYGVILKKN